MTSPPPPTRHIVQVRAGLDLRLHEAGQGSPVLVLHGGPGPGSLNPLVDHLAARHRVLAPTHPGWDGTARSDDLDSVPALAAVYLNLLDHLGVDDVAVIGTSFGGWVAAQTVLDDRAGRVSRLVLMDAIGPVVPGQQVTAPTGPPPQDPVPAGGPTPRGGPSPQSMAALRTYAGPAMSDVDLLPRLSTVACPVLVIWGGDDTVVTPDFGRAYAAAFPHVRFELVEGAGHLPLREQPEAVFTLLDSFLTPGDATARR
ncbi:alpha/beta fold hydrolase [Streptomyces sp. MH60]|uniref:alpha/beta fold hydrolase n=1 Tax=Streptomyces sp. MH60 TaxID=1940758 RepID=UPI000CEDAD4E|nr:alpha/beta hydrolase [Streptomyces sp. MH60]PPS90827.1 4,5:9,10-diseco-3-hydroxy-5,9,17-trioxoandrosta-1(10),2-diene-4-oate hydrolase [Streptomyces sp. MH60]